MSLNIRKFNKAQDGADVKKWWSKQGWDENTIHVISDTGYIVEENNVKIAATWLIKTNTPIYMIEWTVGNPEVNWELRKEALDSLTDYACSQAKEFGAQAVMIMTKSDRYLEKLKNNKFIESDANMTHVIRSL